MSRPWSVAVVIPAHNEAARLPQALAAVLRSIDSIGDEATATVVVAADACIDETAPRAARLLGSRGFVLPLNARDPGRARRAGTSWVLDRWQHVDTRRLWLANTDADSVVPETWLQTHLELARAGVAAVAGVVEVDDFAELPEGTARRFEAVYARRPDGTHPHVHGANLGVRADAYLDAGGWQSAQAGEDHALWRRVTAAAWTTVSSTSSVVVTSGRERGRAVGGFADTLRALGAEAS